MKNYISVLAAFLCSTLMVLGANPNTEKMQQLPFEKNITTPALPAAKHKSQIAKAKGMVDFFTEAGLKAKLTRNDEVVVVTIPVAEVFKANSAQPIYNAERIFDKFREAYKKGDEYRLVAAVYTDNTGDDTYSKNLTDSRVEALKALMKNSAAIVGVSQPNINYYSMGNSNPVVPNNSLVNRATNRRIEVYIIPED